MKISESGAKFSEIVKIGEDLRAKSRETGEEYLYLNRGINQVVNIDLSKIIPLIDFNSGGIQYYPHSKGMYDLRKAINKEFFGNNTSDESIYVTGGGMHGLYLTFQTLNLKKVFTHAFYWGAYSNVLKITGKKQLFFDDFESIIEKPGKFKNSAVIICDPNNPTGSKSDDDVLIKVLDVLKDSGAVVIWDGPYRRLFYNDTDTLYQKLLEYDNVIITESFSKSIGLSGQRIGFMHSNNEQFNNEFGLRLLYSGNGINAFAQILVEKILTTEEGKKAAKDFKEKTISDIAANISVLKEKGILAEEFYKGQTPLGIFVIVNKSYQELKEHKIGSVPLNYFTKQTDIDTDKYSRICVSIPKNRFKEFLKVF